MTYTLDKLNRMMMKNGGWLDLRGTPITSLPEGLIVGGWLDLRGTPITSLPEGLTVGEWLDLSGTPITSLPEGLTVGGSLDLSGTPITSLPEGLTIGRSLNLRGTQITSLPDGLIVGGWLSLRGTKIAGNREYRTLQDGDYVPGRYLYADGILTHVLRERRVGGYTMYVGKIPGRHVVTDGVHFAHCRTLRQGVADLAFKAQADRGAEQYRGTDMDMPMPLSDCITMYRIITGACSAGTEAFVESLPELREAYTVREMITITEGQYGADVFRRFWEEAE